MGSRNLDRISVAEWRNRCETIEDFARDRIEVISACRKCGLQMPVDLALVARVSGAKTSLWNRHPQCKRLGCDGVVDFKAKFWGANSYQTLEAPWPVGKPPR